MRVKIAKSRDFDHKLVIELSAYSVLTSDGFRDQFTPDDGRRNLGY